MYFDDDDDDGDDDDFFLLVRIPFVIRHISFYGLLTYYILHTFVPLVAKKKQNKNHRKMLRFILCA